MLREMGVGTITSGNNYNRNYTIIDVQIYLHLTIGE